MTVEETVKKASIYIPPDNRRCYIKRLKNDGTYDANWLEISKYVTKWGTISQGEPDGVFLGEYKESDMTIDLDNSTRKFNSEEDYMSLWSGYKTRFKTLFKVEVYAVDDTDADLLLKAWYGISFGNPVINDKSDMSFTVSPTTKILNYYPASGISLASGTTEELVERLVNKTKDSVSLFDRYFTGFKINPDAESVMTISQPYIKEGETVLKKLRDYSFYQDFIYYVDNDGYLVWDSREATAAVQWEFNGAGNTDSSYGTNIQEINSMVDDIDNTYNKIVIEYAENTQMDTNIFSGIRKDDGTGSALSDANSLTIYNQMVTDLYIGTDSRLTQLYVTDRSTLDTYIQTSWADYEDNIIDKLDDTIKGSTKTYTAETSWAIGDGSVADIYGEKVFEKTYTELTGTEATTIANRVLDDYKNPKAIIKGKVTGAFILEPKDRVKINYLGESTVQNPFILGVSELGSGDVIGGRSGSIRLNDWIGRVHTISINLDNFDIMQIWKEL